MNEPKQKTEFTIPTTLTITITEKTGTLLKILASEVDSKSVKNNKWTWNDLNQKKVGERLIQRAIRYGKTKRDLKKAKIRIKGDPELDAYKNYFGASETSKQVTKTSPSSSK